MMACRLVGAPPLQSRQDEKADSERGEAPEQDRAEMVNLVVQALTRLRDLEPPTDWRSGQDGVLLDDSEGLGMAMAREFVAVVKMRFEVRVAGVDT